MYINITKAWWDYKSFYLLDYKAHTQARSKQLSVAKNYISSQNSD